ncbi:hypothetical protein KDI_46280 [Dictyobacter arantiisoli]|uniref:Uncharacterized protein n=2 Tax=Dictyobacter arantiisoli TaxID=2014874 RepID=A0A5A5TJJ5_9CHLR|nr:hypothetical protein KDI_46280 [Dictyobacter arantiisoli]
MDIPRLHTPPTEVTNDPQERVNMVLDQEHYNWYGSFPAAANSEHYRTYPDGMGGSGVDASGVAAASQEHWGQEDGGSASWFLEQSGSNDDAADFQRGFYTQSPAYAYFPDASHDESHDAPLAPQQAEVGTAPPWGGGDGLDIDNSGRGFSMQPPDDFVRGFYTQSPADAYFPDESHDEQPSPQQAEVGTAPPWGGGDGLDIDNSYMQPLADFVRGFYTQPPDDSAVESHGAQPAEVGTAPEDPSSRLLRSPGLTIYNLNNYLSYKEFALGPGKYTNHSSSERPSSERPKNEHKDEQLTNKMVSALITGEREHANGWVNANGRPDYQPSSDRKEAARKANATKGPEGRKAGARKANEAMKTVNETRGPEGRSKATEKGNATRGSDGRSEAIRKGHKTRGPEGSKEAVRKANETKGPKGRSKATENGNTTKGPEVRSEAIRKGHVTRRRKAAERRDAADAAASRENDRR